MIYLDKAYELLGLLGDRAEAALLLPLSDGRWRLGAPRGNAPVGREIAARALDVAERAAFSLRASDPNQIADTIMTKASTTRPISSNVKTACNLWNDKHGHTRKGSHIFILH